MSESLSADTFSGHEGSIFRVRIGDDTVELELDRVTEHDRPDQESFSVLFRGPKADAFQHGMYHVDHDELGEHDLPLGPVTIGNADEDVLYFEATITRLEESASRS